jgi:hypothetical protein
MAIHSSITASATRVPRAITNMIQVQDNAARMATRFTIMVCVTSVRRAITRSGRVGGIAARQDTRIIITDNAGNVSREVSTIPRPVCAALAITRIITMADVTSVRRGIQNTPQAVGSAARTGIRIILMHNAGSARRAVHMTRRPARAVQGTTRLTTRGNATSAKKDFLNTRPVKATVVRKAIPIFPEINVTKQRDLTKPGQNPQLLRLVPEQQ